MVIPILMKLIMLFIACCIMVNKMVFIAGTWDKKWFLYISIFTFYCSIFTCSFCTLKASDTMFKNIWYELCCQTVA